MSTRLLLSRLIAGPATGTELATELGLTRGGVWKRIEALRALGVDVVAQPGRGYALAQPLSLLDGDTLTRALSSSARAVFFGNPPGSFLLMKWITCSLTGAGPTVAGGRVVCRRETLRSRSTPHHLRDGRHPAG